ncbi:MAG: hypothetical protein GX089_08540 [Fibrobacter sp.]|jgi:hypothetical protein|nr:hypothetical protein [Fibrobacter sp.]
MSKITNINDQLIKGHLGTMVKDTVEENLNSMLDARDFDIRANKQYMSFKSHAMIPR